MILELKIKKEPDDPTFYTVKKINAHKDQCIVTEWWQLKKNNLNWKTPTLIDSILTKEEQSNILDMKLYTSDDNEIYSYLKSVRMLV